MSELRKSWARAKFGGAGPTGGLPEMDEDEDELETREQTDAVPDLPGHVTDDDSSSASSASSTGTIVPSPSQQLFARPQGVPRGRSLDPIPWTTFFERELFLVPASAPPAAAADAHADGHVAALPPSPPPTFHAYFTSPVGKGPLFVMHHGAGSSGLSFAVLASEIRKRLPSAGILSPDARYHGSTAVSADAPLDMTLQTLAADLVTVIHSTKDQMRWPTLPPIVLVGHSLGGAVVTQVASTASASPSTASLAAAILGYVVLDVVEGSAMDALQSMLTYLSTRPAGFASLQAGIDWHVRSRTIRNALSARTSVPSLLVNVGGLVRVGGGGGGGDGGDGGDGGGGDGGGGVGGGGEEDPLPTTPAEGPLPPSPTRRPWRWRTDLAATQPFWEGWFVGLSKKFLSGRGGKMLLLAGTDRLDTELTIGQMQGKYALQVFPDAGHFIHEDLPEKIGISIVDFYRRNDRSALVLPLKVSELLKLGKKV